MIFNHSYLGKVDILKLVEALEKASGVSFMAKKELDSVYGHVTCVFDGVTTEVTVETYETPYIPDIVRELNGNPVRDANGVLMVRGDGRNIKEVYLGSPEIINTVLKEFKNDTI